MSDAQARLDTHAANIDPPPDYPVELEKPDDDDGSGEAGSRTDALGRILAAKLNREELVEMMIAEGIVTDAGHELHYHLQRDLEPVPMRDGKAQPDPLADVVRLRFTKKAYGRHLLNMLTATDDTNTRVLSSWIVGLSTATESLVVRLDGDDFNGAGILAMAIHLGNLPSSVSSASR